MAALTQARNTAELHVGALHYNFERTVNDGGTVYAGGIAAQNSSGKAVPASDTAGLVVLGRAEATVGAGEKVLIRTGVFLFDNGTGSEELTAADIGAAAYIVDDHTVGKVGGTNHIPAGVVVDVTAEGVSVEITPAALKAAGAATTDTNTTYSAATSDTLGLVKQAAAVADATSETVTTQLNALLAAARTAGIVAPNAE
ncbi:MAG: hypothetical protein J5806_02980 [Lentisphaeria bacterium]|nr:hypothetical protein [Lentisphaeria bacterium]